MVVVRWTRDCYRLFYGKSGYVKEAFLTGIRILLHALLVVLAHLLCGRCIQCVYGVEGLIAEFCEDTHVDKPYVALHVGLVLGMDGTCRHHHRTIVVAHVLKHSARVTARTCPS